MHEYRMTGPTLPQRSGNLSSDAASRIRCGNAPASGPISQGPQPPRRCGLREVASCAAAWPIIVTHRNHKRTVPTTTLPMTQDPLSSRTGSPQGLAGCAAAQSGTVTHKRHLTLLKSRLKSCNLQVPITTRESRRRVLILARIHKHSVMSPLKRCKKRIQKYLHAGWYADACRRRSYIEARQICERPKGEGPKA